MYMFSDNESIHLEMYETLELTESGVCSKTVKKPIRVTFNPATNLQPNWAIVESIKSAAEEISQLLSESTLTGGYLQNSKTSGNLEYFNDLSGGRKKFN